MRGVAARLTLPFKLGLRRTNGNVPGTGAGSSIDFQDHRPYVPGDDPRHIDWQAYARSGHYTMKLYREEVRPLADIVLDASPSMLFDPEKHRRAMELAWFCLESALRAGASCRLFSVRGSQPTPHDSLAGWDDLDAPRPSTKNPVPDLSRVPWRSGSLRVLISDLLFPGSPEPVIHSLLGTRGRAIIFAPSCRAESDPDWLGNTELIDCETGSRRDLRFHPDDLPGYTAAYSRHFTLWQTEARRHGIPFAQLPAEIPLADALGTRALRDGAVEFV